MKYWFKIISVVWIATILFFNLCQLRILSELEFAPANPVQDNSFVIYEQSTEYLARINHSQKDTDFRPIKLMSLGKLHTKSSLNQYKFISLKKYIQHNELVFNLPKICFKFPLSEHTEEG